MRKVALFIWLTVLFIAIAVLFWQNEFVYSLPTPVPKNYSVVNPGEKINLAVKVKSKNRPLFLHFFNPDCPCSRFNIAYFKSLVKQYDNEVTFAIVVISSNKNYTSKTIQEKFDLTIPVFFDSTIAASCGVYSTPQAVILDTDCKLYYRGNYNKGRYCTDKKTNYAQAALDSLLHHNFDPIFNPLALKSYGCQLPKCSK